MTATVQGSARSRAWVIRVRGDLDLLAVERFRHELLDATSRDDGRPVVVDLTGVTFVDSTGLGVLVAARTRLADRGATLHLVVDGEHLLRIFRISSLARMFAVHPTLTEAVSAARSASGQRQR